MFANPARRTLTARVIRAQFRSLRYNTTKTTQRTTVSAEEFERRLPKWMAKYSDRFKNNPGSHITSFLILHELTALLPLPLLFWLFHSFDWTPEGLPSEYIEKGAKVASKQLSKWGLNYTGDDGSRYLFEGAAAYAVVKLMLPLRIAASLSLTPLFARRVVVPITRVFRRPPKTKDIEKL